MKSLKIIRRTWHRKGWLSFCLLLTPSPTARRSKNEGVETPLRFEVMLLIYLALADIRQIN